MSAELFDNTARSPYSYSANASSIIGGARVMLEKSVYLVTVLYSDSTRTQYGENTDLPALIIEA